MDEDEQRAVARRLWRQPEQPTIDLWTLPCMYCGDDTDAHVASEQAAVEVICETCASLIDVINEGPLIVDRLTIPAPRADIWPLTPPGPRTILFEPPLVLRLTLHPEGYIVAYENPDDPLAVDVCDVSQDLGVSGDSRKSIIARLAEVWGFHYLVAVATARNPASHEGDRAAAQRDLARLRRVRMIDLPDDR